MPTTLFQIGSEDMIWRFGDKTPGNDEREKGLGFIFPLRSRGPQRGDLDEATLK